LPYAVSVRNSSVGCKTANARGRHFTRADMEDAYISVQKITVATDINISEPS